MFIQANLIMWLLCLHGAFVLGNSSCREYVMMKINQLVMMHITSKCNSECTICTYFRILLLTIDIESSLL